jgi:uncharacterized glyoxalase superfamily protein PhnB
VLEFHFSRSKLLKEIKYKDQANIYLTDYHFQLPDNYFLLIKSLNKELSLTCQVTFIGINIPVMKAKSVVPYLGYKDAPSAIEWLCNAFGFEKHLVVPGENRIIIHAELKFGNVMIMLGSSVHNRETEFSKHLRHPLDIGGFETQTPYIIMNDIDLEEHFEKAKSAGAKIIIELRKEDYGGRNYSCADPEGHLWSFGSYDPWKKEN